MEEPESASAEVLTDGEIRTLEAANLRRALDEARGKVYGPGGAAELVGLKPTTFLSRLKAFGIARR